MKRTFVPMLLFPWVYIPARDAALEKGAGGAVVFSFLGIHTRNYVCFQCLGRIPG